MKNCTIVLNRNLPAVTDRLVESLLRDDDGCNDVVVIEAGSDEDNLSRYCTWWCTDDETVRHGLRYPRGMNYGLRQLVREGKFGNYDTFLMLTNDTVITEKGIVAKMTEVMSEYPRLGILAPCSKKWGEARLIKERSTKFFWSIHNNAFMMRRQFLEDVFDMKSEDWKTLVFDGNNFRGLYTEIEVIAKAYANDWAAGVTNRVLVEEEESYLLSKADLIKTEGYTENMRLYIEEGSCWLKKKYGFKSKWSLEMYAKFFYDEFFRFHPEYGQQRITT